MAGELGVFRACPTLGPVSIETSGALSGCRFSFCRRKMKILGIPPVKQWPLARPVVVTDKCGIAPLLRGRSGLVVKHDAAAIAQGIRAGTVRAGTACALSGCIE